MILRAIRRSPGIPEFFSESPLFSLINEETQNVTVVTFKIIVGWQFGVRCEYQFERLHCFCSPLRVMALPNLPAQ
jgi:hypothetical protein